MSRDAVKCACCLSVPVRCVDDLCFECDAEWMDSPERVDFLTHPPTRRVSWDDAVAAFAIRTGRRKP